MRKTILLNPGPVVVSEKVRKALLQPDICHREPEFTKLLTRTRKKLTTIFKGSPQHTTIILGGSGTAALESVLSSIPRTGTLFILSNGYYGEKLETIANIHNINTKVLKHEWGQEIDKNKVQQILTADPKIEYVAMVHNETSVGILNDVTTIGKLVSKHRKIFIVDAISSIGAEHLNVKKDHIHFCIGTPNKCVESIPGLSFVCADKKQLEKLRNQPPKTSYLDLYNHYAHEEGLGERPGTPFTPPVQAFYALGTALNLLLKEGLENRHKRYAKAAKKIRKRLKTLGFRLLLPPELMSNTITSIIMPKNITYRELHDRLKKKGIVVYAGQGKLREKTLRIANMGALSEKDINRFLNSLEEIVKQLNKHPSY
jgi:2-aminoethylphosphonate-pyruvate transaminase